MKRFLRFMILPVLPDIAFEPIGFLCYTLNVLERQPNAQGNLEMEKNKIGGVPMCFGFDCSALFQLLCKLFGFGC